MTNIANSRTTHRGDPLCADFHFPLCSWGRCAHKESFPRDAVASSTCSKLLEIHLTHRKHRTSHFLIDNLNGFSMKPITLSEVEGSLYPKLQADHSELRSFAGSAGSQLSTLNSLLPSNRQSPELEMDLSYRKQRTEIFLIAKFGALFPIRPPKHASAKAGPARRISNRPSPQLERPVSHRKQRIGTLSNRPKIAILNSDSNSRSSCV